MTAPPRATASRGTQADAALLTAMMTLAFAGVTLTTPLLPTYQAAWSLSVFETTALFAAYVPGVVFSLLMLGGLADVVGARVTLIIGAVLCASATLIALLAQEPLHLIVARIVMGVGVGLIPAATLAGIGAAGVPPVWGARLVSIATTTGIAAGLLLGASTAGLGPAGAQTVYLAVFAPIAVWTLARRNVHEPRRPVARRATVRLAVPSRGRRHFALALSVVALAFTGMGLLAGLGPLFAAGAAASGTVYGAVGAAVAYMLSGLTQLLIAVRFAGPRTGGVVLASGLAVLAVGVGWSSRGALLIAAVCIGIGNGLLFPASFRLADRLAPPGQKAGVISAYYLAMYAGIAIPLLGFGALTDLTSVGTATSVFAVVVGVLAVVLTGRGLEPELDDVSNRRGAA
ncbi:MFS transporter [Microbacterium aurantiacum]|uniref:MFS transporter n=1 Tax=Microbacterium aurantiacum TaxID=162393 RepID=UPI0034317EC9